MFLSPGPKVRPFRLNTDIAPLLHLLAEIEAVDGSGEALSEAQLRVYLDVPQHNPETDRWVIEPQDGASIIAQAALYLPSDVDDRRVADGVLSVHPEWRRRGLGERLFSRLEARLQAASGVERLRFYLDPGDEGAIAFAKARGLEPNPADTYTAMHAVLADVTRAPMLPEGFTLRSYREVDHPPTLVEALNRSFSGLVGHHHTTETDFAPHLARLDPDGFLLLFAPDGSVAGTVSAELAPDLAERYGVTAGRVGSPGVATKWRSPELYAALLLFGVAYLKVQEAVLAELQSVGDDPSVIDRYASLGFAVTHSQVAYERTVQG